MNCPGLYPSIWRRISCGSTFPSSTWALQLHLALQLHAPFLLLSPPSLCPLPSPFFSEEHCCCTAFPTALPKLCNALFNGLPASDIAPSLLHQSLIERADLYFVASSQSSAMAELVLCDPSARLAVWRAAHNSPGYRAATPKDLTNQYLLSLSTRLHLAALIKVSNCVLY